MMEFVALRVLDRQCLRQQLSDGRLPAARNTHCDNQWCIGPLGHRAPRLSVIDRGHAEATPLGRPDQTLAKARARLHRSGPARYLFIE